jgi:hypothetical protein
MRLLVDCQLTTVWLEFGRGAARGHWFSPERQALPVISQKRRRRSRCEWPKVRSLLASRTGAARDRFRLGTVTGVR